MQDLSEEEIYNMEGNETIFLQHLVTKSFMIDRF